MFDDLLGPEELINHLRTANLLSERLKDLYSTFLNPYGGELLRAFNLDVTFEEAEGNWLCYFDEKGIKRKVFDAYGDQGKNLLGHRNLDISQEVFEALSAKTPLLASGSLRKSATLLAKRLNDLLETETGHNHWISSFFSSQQESLKEVCEHLVSRHREKKQIMQIHLQEMYNKLYLAGDSLALNKNQFAGLLRNEKEKSILASVKSTRDLIDALKLINELRLKRRPFILTNRSIRGATNILAFQSNQELEDISEYVDELIIVDEKLKISKKQFTLIAGVILSVVNTQGEFLQESLLLKIRQMADQEDFLLTLDEHLSGVYRTGDDFFCSTKYKIVADIYCYGESLGAGISNFGVISVRGDKFSPAYARELKQTFESELASKVALKVLTLSLKESQQNQDISDYFQQSMNHLKESFGDVVHDIKGQGFLCFITLSENIRNLCFEYKIFDDAHFLSKFLMSGLLKNECLRVFDCDEEGRILLLAPSLLTTKNECDFIYQSLTNLFTALRKMNMNYFFAHVYPEEKIGQASIIPTDSIHYGVSKKPLSVFLCHLINTDHASMLVQSHQKLSKGVFKKKISKITPLLKFDIFYRGIIKDEKGEEREIILMALPTTSEEIIKILKSADSLSLVQKAQEAIAYAKSLGATTIGLGQFTSIMTKNGLLLDPMGMNLTTGNAYTTALSVEALIRKAKETEVDLENSTVACVGAAGNIVSVSAAILADHCSSLILIYHSKLNESEKLQASILTLLQEIKQSRATSKFIVSMQKELSDFPVNNHHDLLQLMEREGVKKIFTITSDIEQLKNADLVVAGASSSDAFIFPNHLKQNAVVVDIGVPANVDQSVKKDRPDVKLILGGIALLPSPNNTQQALTTPAFPLPKGESFACLAETIVMSFLDSERLLHIGPLSKLQIEFIHEKARMLGFKLGQDKTKNSL